MDGVTQMEPVRFPPGSDVVLMLGTLLADGGPGVLRQLRWLGNVVRHPFQFLRVSRPWGKAASSVVLLVMQTVESHTRLVRERQPLWPFTRAITSRPDPGQPGIPSYIPIANEVAREFAADLDWVPMSTLNEVLLDTSTTAHLLGGCGIGAGPDDGVVDSSGRVFGHDGLYVMDGSMIGANLGGQPVADHHRAGRARVQQGSGQSTVIAAKGTPAGHRAPGDPRQRRPSAVRGVGKQCRSDRRGGRSRSAIWPREQNEKSFLLGLVGRQC